MTNAVRLLQDQQLELDKNTDCQQSGFAVLSDWRALLVSGEDAEGFLQNLLTNDVKAAITGQAQLNGFCQAKGRLLAVFWLVRQADGFLLLLPADQAAFLAQRLSMFKLRSKVAITALEDSLLLALPDNRICPDNTAVIDDSLAIAVINATELENTLAKLQQAELTQQTRHCWQQAYIRAGYPMIFAASRERYTAQQVNLDLAAGVSFRKGCYPGQEVVARLHYLGEAKRRLFIGEVAVHDLPEAGTDITSKEGEVAGQLVQGCLLDDGRSLIQMTLKLTMAGQTLFLPGGSEITGVSRLGGGD